MNKQNLLTLTLIISGLALNPVMAESVVERISHNQTSSQSIANGMSTVLYNRGLDEDVADEMVENFLDGTDEMLLAMLMQNLEAQNIVTQDEVLEYLSHAALHKQMLDVQSYDSLIGMVATIQKKSLDKTTLKQLSHIVKINKQVFV